MSLKSVQVPTAFEPLFAKAEGYVDELFRDFRHHPEKGTLHIGGERYVMMRCESLFVSWFDALSGAFGEETAHEFIYNTAREIGRSDAAEFCSRLKVTDSIQRLSAGPVHFAYAGWARVEILGDSTPSADDNYYLHYYHPNTFEAEVLLQRHGKVSKPACLFSAGYSSGWCSEAFGIDVHGREVRCSACGDSRCEFIMAPVHKLSERAAVLAAQ